MAVAHPTAGSLSRSARWQTIWNSIAIIFESRVGTVGLFLVLFWFIIALLSLFWTPFAPNQSLFDPETNLPKQNASPDAENWLGTDHLARDIFSRLMEGTQVVLLKTRIPSEWPVIGGWSLPVGVAIWGVLGSLIVGVTLGLNAGYRGGWWDQVTMQFLDAMIAFPVII